MSKKIFTTSAVFLTILLFVGLSLAQANNQSTVVTNIRKSSDTIDSIRFSANDTLPARPLLSIVKTMNGSIVAPNVVQVEPNTTVRVDVTIKNIGNRTAYNLTTTDPGFEDWALTSLNLTTQRFVKVGINASIYYFYYFTSVIEGNFTVASTTIDYFGINGSEINEYNARTQRFSIFSIKQENIAIIEGSLWIKIFYYCLGISAALGAVVGIDILILRRRAKGTKKPVKRGLEPQLKTKQHQKRKVKKRR
jgi:hypothetical protein